MNYIFTADSKELKVANYYFLGVLLHLNLLILNNGMNVVCVSLYYWDNLNLYNYTDLISLFDIVLFINVWFFQLKDFLQHLLSNRCGGDIVSLPLSGKVFIFSSLLKDSLDRYWFGLLEFSSSTMNFSWHSFLAYTVSVKNLCIRPRGAPQNGLLLRIFCIFHP